MSKPILTELPDGYKEWWLNGQLHRLDGPAVEWKDGYKEWYLNGKEYTKEEFALIQFIPVLTKLTNGYKG